MASVNNVQAELKVPADANRAKREAIPTVLSRSKAEADPLARIRQAYAAIADIEYIENPALKKQLLEKAGISPDVKFVNTSLDPDTKFKLSMVKRAMSCCHGALIAMENSTPAAKQAAIQAAMSHVFALAQQFIDQTMASKKDFSKDSNAFNQHIKQNFNKFLCEINIQIAAGRGFDLTTNTGWAELIEKDFIMAERLANYERRQLHPIATVSENNGRMYVDVDAPVNKLTPAQIKELDRIRSGDHPYWFKKLSKLEKNWWLKNMDSIVKGRFASPPSTYRSTPFASNFTKYSRLTFNGDQLIMQEVGFRRSTMTPIDIYGGKSDRFSGTKTERVRLAAMIADQVLDAANSSGVLMGFWSRDMQRQLNFSSLHLSQNLLTPLPVADRLPISENNTRMIEEATDAVHTAARARAKAGRSADVVLVSNWPINSERAFKGRDNCFDFEKTYTETSEVTETKLVQIKKDGAIVGTKEEKETKKVKDIFTYGNKASKETLEELYVKVCQAVFGDIAGYRDVMPFLQVGEIVKEVDMRKWKFDHKKYDNFIKWVADKRQNWEGAFDKTNRQANINKFLMGLNALSDLCQLWENCQGKTDSAHYYQYSKYNVELFAAAQMVFIVEGIGGTVDNGCKSAKDRKAAELVQIASMAQRFEVDSRLPRYTDTGDARKQFEASYAACYQGHQQIISGDNSFGCDACQEGRSEWTSNWMLKGGSNVRMIPGEIQTTMGVQLLASQNLLGKLNKPKIKLHKYLQKQNKHQKKTPEVKQQVVAEVKAAGLPNLDLAAGPALQYPKTNLVNSHLIAVLQYLDPTGQRLRTIDDVTIRGLNELTWKGTESISAAASVSDPGPSVPRPRKDAEVESKRSRPRAPAVSDAKDDLDVKAEAKGKPAVVVKKGSLDLAVWENERRQLKGLLGFLNDSELTYVQNENARLREIYAGIKTNNSHLSPEALQELTVYKARTERTQFDALKPGEDKVAEAFMRLDLNLAANALQAFFNAQSDEVYGRELYTYLVALEENRATLFDVEKRKLKFELRDKSKQPKAKVKEEKNKLAPDFVEQSKHMEKIGIVEAVMQLADHPSLLMPGVVDLLRQRLVILKNCLKVAKKGQGEKVFKENVLKKVELEIPALEALISNLHKVILKQPVIDKTVAKLFEKEAELGMKCMPLQQEGRIFFDTLTQITAGLSDLEFLLAHSNNYASFGAYKDQIDNVAKLLKKFEKINSVHDDVAFIEKNLRYLETFDRTNAQIPHFKTLLAKLNAQFDPGQATTWQQIGGLAIRWKKLNSDFNAFTKRRDNAERVAFAKLYPELDEKPRNLFTPLERLELKTAVDLAQASGVKKKATIKKLNKPLLEEEKARKEGETQKLEQKDRKAKLDEYLKKIKSFQEKLDKFYKNIHGQLADVALEVKETEPRETASYYHARQKLAAELAHKQFDSEQKGVKLLPAQVWVEFDAMIKLIDQQYKEYDLIQDKLAKSMPDYRFTLKAPQEILVHLAVLKNAISGMRNNINADLINLEILRDRHKKLYLKAALLNPVLHQLIDKYPNIFSDDPEKQKDQVAIFNKAVIEGLTVKEIKKLLRDNQLDLEITPEHFTQLGRFNELAGDIFAARITDGNDILRALGAKGLAVTADDLRAFVALDRNTPAVAAKLDLRPQILAAKKELHDLEQAAAHFKHTWTIHANKSQISTYEAVLEQKEIKNLHDYAKKLNGLMELAHSVLSFDHNEKLGKLRQLKGFFEKVPDSKEQLQEIERLISLVTQDQEITGAERGAARRVIGIDEQGRVSGPSRLEEYYNNLFAELGEIDKEFRADHNLFDAVADINAETDIGLLKSVETSYANIKRFLALLPALVDALQFASTLPANNIARQNYDRLVTLKDKLIPEHQQLLPTYEGEGGRLKVAQKRIEELQKIEALEQEQKASEKRNAKLESLEQEKARWESINLEIHVTNRNSLSALQAEADKFTRVLDSMAKRERELQTEFEPIRIAYKDPRLRVAYEELLELISKKQLALKACLAQIKTLTDQHAANEVQSLADIDEILPAYQKLANKISVAVMTAVDYAKVNDFNLLPLLKRLLQSDNPGVTYHGILEENKFLLGFGKKAIAKYLEKIANLLTQLRQLPSLQVIEDKLALIHDQDTRQQREIIAQVKALVDTSSLEALSHEHEASAAAQNIHAVFANNDLLYKVLMAKGLMSVPVDLNQMRAALRAVTGAKLPDDETVQTAVLTYKQFKARYPHLPPISEDVFNRIRAVEQNLVLAEVPEVLRDFDNLTAAVKKATQEMSELCLRFSILDFSKDRQILRQAKLAVNNHNEVTKMREFVGKFTEQVQAFSAQRQKFKELYVIQQRVKLVAKGYNRALSENDKAIDAMLSEQQAYLKSMHQYNQSWVRYLNAQANSAIEKAKELLRPKGKRQTAKDKFEKIKDHLEYMQELLKLMPMITAENFDQHFELLKKLNINEVSARDLLNKFLELKKLIVSLNEEKSVLAELVQQEPLVVQAESKRMSSEAKVQPARAVESKRKPRDEKSPLLAGLERESVDFKRVPHESKKARVDVEEESKTAPVKKPPFEPPMSAKLVHSMSTMTIQTPAQVTPVSEIKGTLPAQVNVPKAPEKKPELIPEAKRVEVARTHKGNQVTTDYIHKQVVGIFNGDGKDVAQNTALQFMKFNERFGYLQNEDERVCRKTAIWIYALNNVNNILMQKNDTKTLSMTYKKGKNWVTEVYKPEAEYYQFFGFIYDDVKEIQVKTQEILQAIQQNIPSKYSAPTKALEPDEQNRLNAENVQQVMRVH